MTETPKAIAPRPSSSALPIACIALLLSLLCCIAFAHLVTGKRYVLTYGVDINNPLDNHVASLRLNQNQEPVLTVYGKGAAELTITIPPPNLSHAFRIETGTDGTLLLREVKESGK